MDKRDFVLAAMAPANGAPHTPVQIQKILFLLDREIADKLDGPHFHFVPYNYGPFDSDVYATLDELESEDLVYISRETNIRKYRLTIAGQFEGIEVLDSLSEKVQQYITKVSEFVRSLSFSQLVSTIYKAYPEMRANSVFQG